MSKPFIPYLDIDIFQTKVGFAKSLTIYKKELNRLAAPNNPITRVDNNFMATVSATVSDQFYVWVYANTGEAFNCLSLERLYAFLGHEALHVSKAIFDYLGEDKAGEEILTYTTQHITEFLIKEAMKVLRRQKL